MSKSKLSAKDTIQVWVLAGGRCQYPACSKALWRDDVSLAKMNAAYLAHIYGDQPGGPRYVAGISEQRAKDPSNFMLLCDVHHRLVDIVDVGGHKPELLFSYKREHEDRIERLTSIQAHRKTHIILMGSRIGDHSGLVSYDQAREAVTANGRWPETDQPICVSIADAPVSDRDKAYWTLVTSTIDQTLARTVSAGVGPTNKPISHLSVFALAPIPALIYFGKALGDIIPADVYQRHRGHEDWTWRNPSPDGFAFHLREPAGEVAERAEHTHVAVSMAISAPVPDEVISRALGHLPPVYELYVDDKSNRVVQSSDQTELFAVRWRRLLTQIQEDHGPDVRISLFPAIPVSIAVQLGRELLPKGDPRLDVYDKQGESGFVYALTV